MCSGRHTDRSKVGWRSWCAGRTPPASLNCSREKKVSVSVLWSFPERGSRRMSWHRRMAWPYAASERCRWISIFSPSPFGRKSVKFGTIRYFVLSGLFILSILAWGGSNILHQKRVSEKLDSEIKQLGTEVASINRTQTKLKGLEDKIDALNALRQRHVPALSVLRDLSKELPEGAWLDRLAITDKGGEIEGSADSASKLIPLLAASPLLKDVAFLSPITKGKDGKERFRIGFKMR